MIPRKKTAYPADPTPESVWGAGHEAEKQGSHEAEVIVVGDQATLRELNRAIERNGGVYAEMDWRGTVNEHRLWGLPIHLSGFVPSGEVWVIAPPPRGPIPWDVPVVEPEKVGKWTRLGRRVKGWFRR